MAMDLKCSKAYVISPEQRAQTIAVAKQIGPRFRAQPIVRVKNLEVRGIELLCRNWLTYQDRASMLKEDIAALKSAAEMVKTGVYETVHCNAEISSILSLDWIEALARDVTTGVVIEIVERNTLLMDEALLEQVLRTLFLARHFGGKIAMDDVIYNDQNIHLIEKIQPEIVKVERAEYIPDLRKHGEMEIVVERIETEELAKQAMDLGADYLQGYWCDFQTQSCVPSVLTPPGVEAWKKGQWPTEPPTHPLSEPVILAA